MATVRCNGATLYYEDRGEGRPLVFVHGAWVGLRFFQPQLAGLSGAYRTVAFDFRGHGRSEKTDHGHTIEQYAHDLRAFLDRREIDDGVLVGWSLGALVSWEYVDRYGTDGVAALVNVDMEPSPGDWSGEGAGRYDADQLREIHAGVQRNHLEFTDRLHANLLKEPPSDETRRMMFDEASRCPPSVKSSIILDATTCDYRDVLPEVDVPSLVCAGADEKWRSVAAVERSRELLPDAEFELFEESGHALTIEEPERFNRVLGRFVESL
jgi:pimeloyl-ACP methyl ester carboxylesterase